MNQEIKKEWVAALRSGKYKQGRGYLLKNDEFCCLGVLCELAYKKGKVIRNEDDFLHINYGEWKESSYLPIEVQTWAKLDSSIGIIFDKEGRQISLPRKNDGGCNFAQIANIIEENL